MRSFPHDLVLDSPPCFGFTPSEFLNLNNFLINSLTKMKRLLQGCSSVAASMQQSNMYATTGGDKVANKSGYLLVCSNLAASISGYRLTEQLLAVSCS